MQDTRALHEMQAAMRKAQGIEECMRLLPGLLGLTEAIVDKPGVNPAQLDQIAAYLAEIRFLLGEVEHFAATNGPGDPTVLRVVERYRDLEGRVKELRNDLRRVGLGTAGRS